MIVLYILGYFSRNKQNSYAALISNLYGEEIYCNKYMQNVVHKFEKGIQCVKIIKK